MKLVCQSFRKDFSHSGHLSGRKALFLKLMMPAELSLVRSLARLLHHSFKIQHHTVNPMEQNEHPRKRPRLEEPSHPDTELQQNGDTTMKDSNSHSGEDLTAQQAAERAKEEKAGITAFASPGTEGFTGLLKTRFAGTRYSERLLKSNSPRIGIPTSS